MKRHFPGLHSEASRGDGVLEGVFLVRVDRAYYRWHPQKPFFILSFAILDGTKCIIDWKTTASRYPEQPDGLLSLDPQLVCYSWMTGIADVSLVVFVRKTTPEIQYLKTSIDEEQRREFGQLVETAVEQIEAGHFLPHSGIRFPQNGCVGCSHLGLCLGNQQLMDSKLIRRPGAMDLDWLDQFDD
jgi:hypothetical protein